MVKIDGGSAASRAQHAANLAYARGYRAAPAAGEGRPRILVTGFGRFGEHTSNATGRIVAGLVEGLRYPDSPAPLAGQVDPPAALHAVGEASLALPEAGEVTLRAAILPVFWDLAAALILAEIETFAPDLVVMNGIGGPIQPLWIELGAVNRARRADDASGSLRPLTEDAPLVEGDPLARPNLASWAAVRRSAAEALEREGEVADDATPLSAVLPAVRLARFPRPSNTYLCNNVTYLVGRALDHPGESLTLLEGPDDALRVDVAFDGRRCPRWFLHWPSRLQGAHLPAAGRILCALLDAQLAAMGDLAPGDASLAEPLDAAVGATW